MREKILIIDDSATARALFKACLPSGAKYQVLEADNCDDAVALATVEKPFLIIFDYNMPDKSGAEVAQIMREKGVEAHFVLMSANTQQSVVDEVTALGFKKVIEKPVSSEAVMSLLEELA